MRSSRKLGVALLLMLGASGCAGFQQRTGSASTGPDGTAQASSSGWFGSRWWRPMPTETTRQGSEIAPEYQAERKGTPETNIWPESRPTARLSRLFTRFGRRDNTSADPSSLIDSDSQARGLKTTARPGAGRGDDRQVQPVAATRNEGGPAAGETVSRSVSGVASQDVPPLLASPIAVGVPDKPYDRPAFQGNVALSIAQAELPSGDDQAGSSSQDDRMAAAPALVDQTPDPAAREFGRYRPKRESYLIPAAAGAADPQASESDEPAQATPGQAPPPARSAPPPAIEPAQTAPRTRPAQPPAGGSRPGMTRPAAPAQQPTAPPARRTAPAPAPAQAPATRVPRTTPPAPVAAPPVAAPAPVTETAQPPAETVPTPPPAPAAPAEQPASSVTEQQSFPGAGLAPTASILASPQANVGGCECAAKPQRKPCRLKAWIQSLHHEHEPGPLCSPQLPPPMFPTTYQMCQAAQKTPCPPAAVTVQPTLQQTDQPAQQAQTKKCFAWIGKGPVSCLARKLKALGSGCRCHCRCPDQAARPACGGSCATGNCGTGTIAPSPQAGPASLQSPATTSSLNPEPRDVAQGGEVLERIAAQGLDKSSQP